jgi:UDP-glucose 4-epimerase
MGDVAVVGAASFIATALVEEVRRAESDRRIRAIDNFSTGNEARLRAVMDDDELIAVDIRDAAACRDALDGCDVVVQFAAILSSGFEANARLGAEVNVAGALNVVEASHLAGARLVLSSSAGGVYGRPPAGVVTEETAFHHQALPVGTAMYGASKILQEGYCRWLTERDPSFQWISLRYSSVYGPHQHGRGRHTALLVDLLQALVAGRPAAFPRPRAEAHDFIHVDDVVRANLLAAAAQAAAMRSAYTIATGVSTTNGELVALAEQLTGRVGAVDWSGAPPATRPLVAFDVGGAARELGFHAEVSLDEGLRQLLRSLGPVEVMSS